MTAKSNSTWEAPITSKVTIPASVAISGTLTSVGTVVTGIGTDFQNDVKLGDWIYDAAQNEIRQIKSISERTEVFHLTRAFSVDLAAIAAVRVPESDLQELSLSNDGAAAGAIDGNTFPSGKIATFDKKNTVNMGANRFIDPKVVDGTGTSIAVLKIR